MELSIPDQLPQLAHGAHEQGSGQACIMNAISYLNGDKHITDMPNCVFAPLAVVAQELNDNICFKAVGHCHEKVASPLLCPEHTHMMWLFGGRLIGTAEAARNLVGTNHWRQSRLAIQLGLWAVRYLDVEPQDLHIAKRTQAVQNWLEGKTSTTKVRKLLLCDNHDCATECDVVDRLLLAISDAPERMAYAAGALAIPVGCGRLTAEEEMAFAYALLAEFDRLTGKEHLHQWTADEFALVQDRADVPLVSITA